MQFVGLMALMALGWALFAGDSTLVGWVFVGLLLLQRASVARTLKVGRSRRRAAWLPTFGARRGRSRGGYSTPASPRSARAWARLSRPRAPVPLGR